MTAEEIKQAKEFLFSKYPCVNPEWFDNNELTKEMITMMAEYAEHRISKLLPTEEERAAKIAEICHPTRGDIRGVRSPAMMLAEYDIWILEQLTGE